MSVPLVCLIGGLSLHFLQYSAVLLVIGARQLKHLRTSLEEFSLRCCLAMVFIATSLTEFRTIALIVLTEILIVLNIAWMH